ncbi:MAG: hypothetical protein ACOY3K_01590, partial [Candidatus Omnitrophota bacterium]
NWADEYWDEDVNWEEEDWGAENWIDEGNWEDLNTVPEALKETAAEVVETVKETVPAAVEEKAAEAVEVVKAAVPGPEKAAEEAATPAPAESEAVS